MLELDYEYMAGLVTQAQQNSSDAFAELYALTYKRVYNYARHYLKDEHLAQDAVQEVYILALRNIHKLKDPSLFIAWLNQISFRVCYDLSKKYSHQNSELNADDMVILSDDHLDHNPEQKATRLAEQQAIREAVDKLPQLEHQIIIMRYYNNMKLEDIASALSLSLSTVKRRLNSGRKKLEGTLSGWKGEYKL